MLTVRFIRHGESLANAGGVTSETRSTSLTDLGRTQAIEISRSFAAPPALIVTSPYLRARHTANPTVERFPEVPLEIWPVQEFTYLAEARCLNTTTLQRLPWATEFWTAADPHRIDGDGAESYCAMIGRVHTMLEQLTRLDIPSAAVFSHGIFMKAVHWEIEKRGGDISPDHMRGFRAFNLAAPIANAEGFDVHWDGKAWQIGG
jgi:broad specificity phosphatase PhoE